MRFGYTVQYWQELASALKRHAQDYAVISEVASLHGIRYSVDGILITPDGRGVSIRSVWIIDNSMTAPRLITAHPI